MYRKIFLFLFCGLVLSGCVNVEGGKDHACSNQNGTERFIIDEELRWFPYAGEPKEYDIELLQEVPYSTKNGVVSLLGDHYILMEEPGEELRTVITCGWKLQLDKLTAIAKIAPSTVVFARDGEENYPFLLILNEETNDAQWLARENSGLNDITRLKFDEFDVSYNTEEIENEISIEKLWDYHTNSAYTQAGGVLDGEWKSGCITLTYRKCDALVYCINFGIGNDKLYISNAANGIILEVPFAEIFQ